MRLENPRVIVWFNPEDPTLCGVTDRNGENPIVARLETDVPNHDAAPELLARAHSENAAFERPGKELYRTLKPIFSTEFEQRRVRPVISDGIAAETGLVFREQGEAAKAEEKVKAGLQRRASKLGLNVNRNDPRYVQRIEATADLQEWLEKQERAKETTRATRANGLKANRQASRAIHPARSLNAGCWPISWQRGAKCWALPKIGN